MPARRIGCRNEVCYVTLLNGVPLLFRIPSFGFALDRNKGSTMSDANEVNS